MSDPKLTTPGYRLTEKGSPERRVNVLGRGTSTGQIGRRMTKDTPTPSAPIDDAAIERAINALWDDQYASLAGRPNIEAVVNTVILALLDEMPEDDA